jgi:hypothetical protein
VPFENLRSPSPSHQPGSQSSAKCQPDFKNTRQNSRNNQELFLLRSLSMDNHNAIRFLHPIHGEDKVAGAPLQSRGAFRPVPCAPDGADQCNARCTYCSCATVSEWITRKGNLAAELFHECTSGCG